MLGEDAGIPNRRISNIDASDSADDHALRWFLDAGIQTVAGRLHPDTVPAMLTLAALQADRGVRGGVGAIGAGNARLAVLLALLAGSQEGVVVVDVGTTPFGAGARRPRVEALRADLARCLPEPDLVAIVAEDGAPLTADDLVDAADGPLRLVGVEALGSGEEQRRGLELAAGALAPGGVVVLDARVERGRPELRAGAARFLREPRGPALVPFATGGERVWLAGSEADAAVYRRSLDRDPLGGGLRSHDALAGHEVVRLGAGAGG